jgi:hypothetical protein
MVNLEQDKRRRQRGGTPRIGSATGMLGLGFNLIGTWKTKQPIDPVLVELKKDPGDVS